MDAVTGAGALLAALVLLVVPGLALLTSLRPAAGLERNLALAPAVSLGAAWAVATALTVLRLPVDPHLLGVLVLVLPALLLVVVRRGRVREPGAQALRIDRVDVVVLVVALLLVLGEWWWATRGFSAVPPRDDGTHHGFYVARILATHSVDPSQVLVGDVVTGQQLWSFYPLALHAVAAVVASLGIPAGTAVNAVWVSIAALALPLGMFALARRTFPSVPRAAAVVALLAALLPAMPTAQLDWGGLAVVAGLALAPAVVDETIGLLDPLEIDVREELLGGLALGLAVVGMFFTHSAELATVVVVVLCLLLGDRALRPALRRWREALIPGAVAAAALVLVTLPWVGDLRSGAGERYLIAASHDVEGATLVSKLLFYSVGPVPVAWLVGALAVLGAVTAWRRGAAGWLWLAGVVALLSVAVGLSLPGSALLSAPWYSNLNRTALMLAYPTAALAGVGTWWLASRIASLVPARGRRPVGALVVAVPVVALLATIVPLASRAYAEVDEHGAGRSLATADAIDSWGWLAAHVSPGERVLNEFSDGSGWMYAVSGLSPVFPQKLETWQLTGDAAYLLEHAADVATDPKARAAAEALDVHYAYLGPRHFPNSPAPALTEELLVAGGWTVVQRTPTTVVLEIPPAA